MNVAKPLPLVSVIVPVYNTADYLRECLDSLLAQTLTNIEIICVNDGSTDSSREILDEYQAKDARVLVVDQENQGVSVARNAGVERASGKYVCFVDSDDYVTRDFCERSSSVAEKNAADVARFYTRRELKKTCKRFPRAKKLCAKGLKACYDAPTSDERRLFVYLSGFHACWSCLYRREFWVRAKLRFPVGIRLSEDTFVNYAASASCERIAFFEASLYCWRKRAGSASHPDANARLGSYADAFITTQMARELFLRKEETRALCEPLAEIFAYMQRNVQTPLSQDERAKWRTLVDETLDATFKNAFYRRGGLPLSVRQFWLGLYGRNARERVVGKLVSSVFIGLRRAEASFKRRVLLPLRGKK